MVYEGKVDGVKVGGAIVVKQGVIESRVMERVGRARVVERGGVGVTRQGVMGKRVAERARVVR